MSRAPEKSEGAFRTIREVADWLGVPTHVLRFWESKFPQIAPVKGSGGRRYYRPEDMRLLGGIKVMLHDQGMTIRAVSQRLDDDGTEPVMALSPPLDEPAEATAPRKRRVIRQGEDAATPPRVVPLDEVRRERSGAIAKEGASPLEEMLPDQPDAPDAVEEIALPEPMPSAPAPEPGPNAGPGEAPPPGVPDEPLPSAPADPPAQVFHAPEPERRRAEPVAPAPEPSTRVHPLTRLRALARAAEPPREAERMRVRRLVRRLRGLRDEIAEDLADGDRG